MRFSTITMILSLAASTLGAPVRRADSCEAVATTDSSSSASASETATVSAAADGSVLTESAFNDFTVSDGVGGSALAEVNAQFPIDLNNLAGVSAADLDIISKAAKISEQAEVATGGFNDAIAAAGAKTDAGKALQVGKIKNKVLKLQTDVLRLKIVIAQGATDKASELTVQQKKLDTNIALDAAQAGETATGIDFDGGSD